jgi:hypothetical protein
MKGGAYCGFQNAGPKNHLTFAIPLHLFQLILDDDGLVN